jgi:predicted nucleic-acid-binding protein
MRFEDEHSIEEALFAWKDSPADFADCLIDARHRTLECRAIASFDAKATKLPGFIAA